MTHSTIEAVYQADGRPFAGNEKAEAGRVSKRSSGVPERGVDGGLLGEREGGREGRGRMKRGRARVEI